MHKLQCRVVDCIKAIGEQAWQRCAGSDYPFTRYEFLHALETAGAADAACTTASGWQPRHVTISDDGRVIAVLPMYLKQHSYGEYIFDWAWAEAYQRNGLAYYPKLLAAIPFTPASGQRLAIDPAALDEGISEQQLLHHLGAEVPALCSAGNVSSFHLLYAQQDDAQALANTGLLLRHSFQYHWFNRNEQGQKLANF
ncbi:MAG: peptidogalycan biosysnthesis protein, partial [Pseudomonadales bacterium]